MGVAVRVRTQTWATLDLSCPLPAPGQFPRPLQLLLHPFCGLPVAAGLPSPSLAPQYCHTAGDSMGLRVGGQRAQGHTVRRVEAVPDASISRPWISVSAQGQVHKLILNLILRKYLITRWRGSLQKTGLYSSRVSVSPKTGKGQKRFPV